LGRIHKPDLRRLLGFESGRQIAAFLNAHYFYDEWTIEELNREVAMLEHWAPLSVEAICPRRRIHIHALNQRGHCNLSQFLGDLRTHFEAAKEFNLALYRLLPTAIRFCWRPSPSSRPERVA
jgi:hypothetical protein